MNANRRAVLITIVTACFILVVAAAPAQAQFRNMGWGDSPPGHMELIFDCQQPPPDATLVVSFVSPVPDIIGITAVVDMCTKPSDLPEWWRFDLVGGCREGTIEVSTNFAAGPSSHPSAWSGPVSSSLQIIPGYAWSAAMNRFRITLIPANPPTSLVVGEEYYAFKLRFVTPAGTCAGCPIHACFVINELTITSSSGKHETQLGDGFAKWQGDTDPGCPFVVPAAAATWGRLKASYR